MPRILTFLLGAIVGVLLAILFSGESPTPIDDGGVLGASDRTSSETSPPRTVSREIASPDPVPQRTSVSLDATHERHANRGTLLFGDCRDDGGATIESCRLLFSDPTNPERRRHAHVEGGHGYAIPGMEAGTWTVSCKPDGYAALRQSIEVRAERSQRLDLVFSRAHFVAVRIQTPDGTELSDALTAAGFPMHVEVVAIATREAPTSDLPMTDARAHRVFGIGAWTRTHGPLAERENQAHANASGILELAEPPPAHVSAVFRHALLATKPVQLGQESVVLEVAIDEVLARLATVSLQVVDAETGVPVAASAGLSDSQSDGGVSKTDDLGRITLEYERIGIVRLEILATGYERRVQQLRLAPGARDLGRIPLARARSIRGQVVRADNSGQPATIRCYDLDRMEFPQALMSNTYVRTLDNGEFELTALGAGRYLVQAVVDDSAIGSVHVDTTRVTERVRIVVENLIPVRIERASPRSRKPQLVSILDTQRRPVWSHHIRGDSATANLPAGEHAFEIFDGVNLVESGRIHVRPDAEATIRLP